MVRVGTVDRADAEAVADEQHTDHQLKINRGAARGGVERGQLLAQAGEIDEAVDGAQEMVGGTVGVERERLEQSTLLDLLMSHHILLPAAERRPIDRSRHNISKIRKKYFRDNLDILQ